MPDYWSNVKVFIFLVMLATQLCYVNVQMALLKSNHGDPTAFFWIYAMQEEDLSEGRASCWDALHKEEHCCRGLESRQMPSHWVSTGTGVLSFVIFLMTLR